MRAYGAWWLFSELDVFESRGRLLGFVAGMHREERNFEIKERTCTRSCAQY